MLKQTIMWSAFAGVATLCFTTPAFALDGKTFPGAFCQERYNSDSDFYTDQYGRAYNRSGNTQDWSCPVARDYMGNGVGNASVWVIDRHYSHAISCTLFAVQEGGTSVYYQTRSSTGSNSAAQELVFGSLTTYHDGYLNFHCRVPGVYSSSASGIVGYKVDEYN